MKKNQKRNFHAFPFNLNNLIFYNLFFHWSVFCKDIIHFPPPSERLGRYVVNSGNGLDTGCSVRSDGPLQIAIPIPQVINSTQLNPDGTLIDAAKLVANGVISHQAVIRFPVYDIDDKDKESGYSPEVDRVLFNGRFKKTLEGYSDTWTDDTLTIPISEIRFGKVNILEIEIDTANSEEIWCMSVDWVSVEFEVTPPYILQHGIAADQDTWDQKSAPGVIRALEERGVLFTKFSLGTAVKGNGSSTQNAVELNTKITAFLKPLKADKVHIIAHSKGGLDVQALQVLEPTFSIVSLSTLSTPHLGSVAADLSIIQKQKADEKHNSGTDPNGVASAYLKTSTFGAGPQLPGLADLTTYASTAALNMGHRNNIQNLYSLGANADLNHNNQLSSNESAGLIPSAVHKAAETAWSVLRDFQTANMKLTTIPGKFWGTKTVLTYQTTMADEPRANDIVVTEHSANPDFAQSLGNVDANHATIKNRSNIETILNSTIPLTHTSRGEQ